MPINNISDELFAAFIDGNTSSEQNLQINKILSSYPLEFNDFILASKASFLTDDIDEANEFHLSNSGIATGISSLIAGGIGLAGYLAQHLAQSITVLGASKDLTTENDRIAINLALYMKT